MVADPVLAPIAEAPDRSALILDVDGTLAPIAPRPELAVVPDSTKAELERLAGRYLLVACVSGREGTEAARLVGVDGIAYVGNHGLELDPRANELAEGVRLFRSTIEWPVEDKGLSLSLHYRDVEDEAAAVATLEVVAERARGAGLDPRWGRKVLEIRPAFAPDKGVAVRALLASSGAERGLYAGDDTTDLDAFAGLAGAGLEHVVRVAVASAEAPSELLDAADLVVPGTAGLAELLRSL